MALYEEETLLASEALRHDTAFLRQFARIWDQFTFRLDVLRTWARARTDRADAVVGMGGLLRPIQGGTYRVNERMLQDARANLQGEHASNLGSALADALAREFSCEAFVADPASVDEFEPLARYSGHPLIQRSSLSHALNVHTAAARAARELTIPLERTSLIVTHMGGGISVAPVRGGRIIDINDASSDGPFSPERTGGLPLQQFITLCLSGKRAEDELRKLVMGEGGLTAYLGTNSAQVVEERIREGDGAAREVYEAMAYQIAKEIGAMATVLSGNVQAVVLTGGLASSAMLTGWITDRIRFIAPVLLYPGEDEMRSLAMAALGVLRGDTDCQVY
jgi:butyrate kinase